MRGKEGAELRKTLSGHREGKVENHGQTYKRITLSFEDAPIMIQFK